MAMLGTSFTKVSVKILQYILGNEIGKTKYVSLNVNVCLQNNVPLWFL